MPALNEMHKKEIDCYYKKFLGTIVLKDDKLNFILAQAETLDRILNHNYHYPLVMAKYKSKNILSVLKEDIDSLIAYLNNTQIGDINEAVFSFFKQRIESCHIRKMYRFCRYKPYLFKTQSRCLTRDDQDLFINSGISENIEKRKKKWEAIVPLVLQKRCFIYEKNQKIVSMAHISDIQQGGANIVVMTVPEEQGKGYAQHVVTQAINWSLQKNFLPIYFVDIYNVPSVKLAKSLGFQLISNEIVISACYEKNN